ncbi:MAG: hypothetical protein RLY90_1047 [Pseudomonadota bacterium]|jgi:hypothetical protein
MPSQRNTSHEQLMQLWQYNAHLLMQALTLVQRIQKEAPSGFSFSQALGPHLRHIMEHYTALLNALDGLSPSVCYDDRERDLALQNIADMAAAKLQKLIAELLQRRLAKSWRLDSSLSAVLKTGTHGELEITTHTSLGRELLFLSSHTVHHFALMGQYAQQAGIDMGADFGKAPATLAHERKHR